jgi:hypothetical protein
MPRPALTPTTGKRRSVGYHFTSCTRFAGGHRRGKRVLDSTDVGMVNEVLCKILCHNLTCLIQEQETLGIVPVFWKDEDKEEGPAILSMVRPD